MKILDKTRELVAKIKNMLAGLSALSKQVSAIQGIDYGYCGGAQIVVLAKVGDKDYVKIVTIKGKMTMQECGELVKELESRYGALPVYVDTGMTRTAWDSMYVGKW